MGIAGVHNIENATAAIEVALKVGVAPELIKNALGSFEGVKRRFEYIVKNDKHIYIDDYAHHPEELRAAITSVKSLYPHKKLTTIFQPHLYTRTRDFADGFAEVLDMSDELIMLDIYPARELPIEGVDADMILGQMHLLNKRKCGKQEAISLVRTEQPAILDPAAGSRKLSVPIATILAPTRTNSAASRPLEMPPIATTGTETAAATAPTWARATAFVAGPPDAGAITELRPLIRSPPWRPSTSSGSPISLAT